MGKMDPGADEKWSPQESRTARAPADGAKQEGPARRPLEDKDADDDGGLNPERLGPGQPSGAEPDRRGTSP